MQFAKVALIALAVLVVRDAAQNLIWQEGSAASNFLWGTLDIGPGEVVPFLLALVVLFTC